MKIKVVFLTVLCLTLLLFSCSQNGVSLDDPLGTYEGEYVTVIENGTANYTVIRAEGADFATTASAIKLRQELSARYGCNFPIDTDWVKRGEEAPNDTFEILVGETNRAESQNVANKLGVDDFVIDFCDNRIVILGGSNNATERAVEYFLEKIACAKEGQTTFQVPKTLSLWSKNDYAIDSLTLLGKSISDFNICFDSESDELNNAATLLNDNFKAFAGMSMDYGDINNIVSPAVVLTLDSDNPSTEYLVYTEEGNIYISAASELGIIYAINSIFTDSLGVMGDLPADNNVTIDTISLSGDILENGLYPLGYTLFNMNHAAMVINRSGQIIGIYDIRDGKNYIDLSEESPFAILTTNSTNINSSSFEIADNNVCTVKFGSRIFTFDIIFDDDFTAFKLNQKLDNDGEQLKFMNANLSEIYSEEDGFAVTNYSMAYYLNPSIYPTGKDEAIGMTVYGKFESEGAMGALIAGPKSSHRDIMKSANEYIEEGKVAFSDKGGANALDYEGNFGNYVIVSDSDPSMVDTWIEQCTTYDIDQLDFHKGGSTFLNGSMTFTKFDSAEEFKKQVADPLREAGILCGLHTYAYYIESTDKVILSNPEYQKQLEVLREYTLAEDISRSSKEIKVNESLEGVAVNNVSTAHASNYLLIDQEIVKFTAVADGTFTIERGVGGTTPADHTAGSVVKHLGGCFGMLAPDIDSDLFLQIARNTAEAYNKGGFSMIYLDALDGIGRHTSDGWYYTAKFVNEIFKYCETDPLIEYSTMYPSIWIARGRAGAWDHPRRAYKLGVDIHVKNNTQYSDMHYTSTLGWYDLYPTNTNYPGNTNVEYYFFDDVDYVGAKSLAHDMSFVYQNIGRLNTHPAYVGNMERYALYSDLRKSNYFSEEIKEQIRDGEYEYALLEKGEGEYVFVEKDYTQTKLYDVNDPKRNIITAENPFDTAQVPFIRIEGRYSTEGEDPITLIDLSEPTNVLKVSGYSNSEELNIKKNLAFKVSVLGNNSDDAIYFRLACGTNDDPGTLDFVIPLNYEGWREFVLVEPDNGTFDSDIDLTHYNFYAYCRGVFNYDRLTAVNILEIGNCEGVQMTSLTACKHVANGITNPSITVDGKTITFEGTVASDEYLEYFPGDDSATIYDGYGNGRQVKVSGELPEIAKGEFTATLDGTGENANAPLRATVTFGFTGEELK